MLVFHNISSECYDWLNAQSNVKEETLTDWILFQASLKSKKVFYKTFKRNEEAFNGTDWEWWILTGYGSCYYAYRFLIQAKKLKPIDNYGAITYGNRNGMQIDLLLKSAIERQAYPLYAYYTCTHPNINEQIDNFKNISKDIIRWCENCKNGVYLSSAKEIRHRVIENPKRKISDYELVNNSLGLSMLDLIIQDNPNGTKLLDFINADFIYNFADQEKQDSGYGFKYPIQKAPQYLQFFINNNFNSQRTDWLEGELKSEFKNLSGIAVVDARKGELIQSD